MQTRDKDISACAQQILGQVRKVVVGKDPVRRCQAVSYFILPAGSGSPGCRRSCAGNGCLRN
jgi:hypothetical protein